MSYSVTLNIFTFLSIEFIPKINKKLCLDSEDLVYYYLTSNGYKCDRAIIDLYFFFIESYFLLVKLERERERVVYPFVLHDLFVK